MKQGWENKRMWIWISASLLCVVGFCLLTGCGSKTYKVTLNGKPCDLPGAKRSYRAGEQVTIYFDLIATDTDYTFALEDGELTIGYDEQKGGNYTTVTLYELNNGKDVWEFIEK